MLAILTRQPPTMPFREDRTRLNIAHTAARLIAEEGVADYAVAKRKAARLLGLSEKTPMPGNAEIEEALRVYQSIYLGDEQKALNAQLRRKAVEIMEILQPFTPYLTGSVLDGQATRFSGIDLLLYADTAKDVEIFLLNADWQYKSEETHNEHIETVLHIEWDGIEVRLLIGSTHEERVVLRGHDGRIRERARIDAVRALLATSENHESQ